MFSSEVYTRTLGIMAATQKRKKYSKKRKANLRKYTDIRDVEEYMEDVSRQQKTGWVNITILLYWKQLIILMIIVNLS